MKVYIAAPYTQRHHAFTLMRLLQASGMGISVTSGWITMDNTLDDASARMDLDDVARADALLAYNLPEWNNLGSGGRHVELGYALALKKKVVVLGERMNIFHYLNDVTVVNNVDEAIACLAKR